MRFPNPYWINVLVYFSVQYICIKRIFKMVSHFFLLLCGFWETSKYLAPRVVVDHISKECLVSKDLYILRKKAATTLIDVYVSCTAEKQYCDAFGTCSTTCSYHFIKTRQWFHRLSCFNLIFPPEFDVIIWFFTCLLFWSQLLFAL